MYSFKNDIPFQFNLRQEKIKENDHYFKFARLMVTFVCHQSKLKYYAKRIFRDNFSKQFLTGNLNFNK